MADQRIGSVTKTFTVSLLLQAEAEGLLSLDDMIDQYYEDVPNGDQITLRQMADMTSGIASYTFNEQFQEQLSSDPQRVWTPERCHRIPPFLFGCAVRCAFLGMVAEETSP